MLIPIILFNFSEDTSGRMVAKKGEKEARKIQR